MKRSAPRLPDHVLARDVVTAFDREDTATAVVLDHVAEFDARKLYRSAGYSSMFAYCVETLHRSEDAIYRRIQAARAANRFPTIFGMVADGRLHLSAVCMLAPHLTEETAGDLLAAATHKSKAQIEQMLAERFPRPDVPTLVQALTVAPMPAAAELAPGQVQAPFVPPRQEDRARVKPLAPQRFAVQFTMGQSAHDKLTYVQELLGHQVPSGDLAQVFERALDALIPVLEKRKFAATATPRPSRPRSRTNERHVPSIRPSARLALSSCATSESLVPRRARQQEGARSVEPHPRPR